MTVSGGGLFWLALDGVGHPDDAPHGSPWETDLPTLHPLVRGGQAVDARLGVDGLPQSATGQTSWLTGENAAALMGHHYGPRPGPTLRPLLARALPTRLIRAGGRAELLNFYPPAYFERTDRKGAVPHGCFPLSVLLAGRPLAPPDLTLVPPTLGLGFAPPYTPTRTPDDLRRLGEQIGRQADRADLLMLDLWFSDLLGHGGGPGDRDVLHAAARAYLARLDAFVEGLLGTGARIVVTSDHGNFEDLSVKTHTFARVPFAAHGVTLPAVTDLAAGGRAIADLLGVGLSEPSG